MVVGSWQSGSETLATCDPVFSICVCAFRSDVNSPGVLLYRDRLLFLDRCLHVLPFLVSINLSRRCVYIGAAKFWSRDAALRHSALMSAIR